MGYTYKQLIVTYDSYLLAEWDKTCFITKSLDNILSAVSAFGGNKNPVYVNTQDIHPLRKSEPSTAKARSSSSDKEITIKLGPGQMGNLKAVALAMHKQNMGGR